MSSNDELVEKILALQSGIETPSKWRFVYESGFKDAKAAIITLLNGENNVE